MHFSSLLARADEGTLQTLIGRPALRLLKALDPALAAPSALRELLKHLRSADALLADSSARPLLLALLRPLEAEQLAVLLTTDPSSDSYLTLRTLNLRRGSARERLLFNFFELAPPTPEVVDGPDAQEPVPAQAALFPYQRAAVRRVQTALRVMPQRVLLHMPTGAGKTRTAMHVIADHLRSREPALVVWLAASEELCEQSAAAFSATWHSLGDREVTVQRFWGERELDLEQCRDGLLVANSIAQPSTVSRCLASWRRAVRSS
ncbi:MAG: DEAD/DEAH box helicase family protein [Chloroflexales bacterium]